MKRRLCTIAAAVLLSAATVYSEDGTGGAGGAGGAGEVSIVTAQPLFSQKVTATGRVIPQISARLGARVAGTIDHFATDDGGNMLDAGSAVKAGQELFKLDETTFRNSLALADATLKSAQANLANVTAPTREEQIDQYRQTVGELEVRIADRKREEERYRRLVEQDKALPLRRLEEVQTDLLVLQAMQRAASARLREAEKGATPSQVAMAEARVKEAEAAMKISQDDLRDTAVKAPFDGVVTRRFKSQGDYITATPPTEVLEIVSVDKLEAELSLPETYFRSVEAGRTHVAINTPLADKTLVLPVTRVVPQIDSARGMFQVRVAIPAEQRGKIVAGTFVTASVDVASGDGGVIVPTRALVSEDGRSFVFVAEGGKMKRCEVEVGDRMTEGVVVKKGIKAGDAVVVGQGDGLKDGDPLPASATTQPQTK